jgi:hypothetical protein
VKKRYFVCAALVVSVFVPMTAVAHNLAHLFLPDGTCVELGSGREAPFVGPDKEQLDLIPGTPLPRDEYGVSFVGVAEDNLIFPGACPLQPPPAAASEKKANKK